MHVYLIYPYLFYSYPRLQSGLKITLQCNSFCQIFIIFSNFSSISASVLVAMSVNTSSSDLLMFYQIFRCYSLAGGTVTITLLTATSIFFLFPLYIFILYLGFKRWRSTGTAVSHFDFFTYNTVLVELLCVLGFTLICCGVESDLASMALAGISLLFIHFIGQLLLHILTCLERYLAVTHPITYVSLKNAKGVRMRNITVGCSWLLCFSSLGFLYIHNEAANVMSFTLAVLGLIVISFCSVSILCVLIRPRPVEVGERRQQVDQSKLKAFNTVMAILGVLLLKLIGNIIGTCVYASKKLDDATECAMWLCSLWTNLPSMLPLPLLYLMRQKNLWFRRKK